MTLTEYDPIAAQAVDLWYHQHRPSWHWLLQHIKVVPNGWLQRVLNQGAVATSRTINIRGSYSDLPFKSRDRALFLVHELRHLEQWERYGTGGFLWRLCWEIISTLSYENTPIEQEAEAQETEFLSWYDQWGRVNAPTFFA